MPDNHQWRILVLVCVVGVDEVFDPVWSHADEPVRHHMVLAHHAKLGRTSAHHIRAVWGFVYETRAHAIFLELLDQRLEAGFAFVARLCEAPNPQGRIKGGLVQLCVPLVLDRVDDVVGRILGLGIVRCPAPAKTLFAPKRKPNASPVHIYIYIYIKIKNIYIYVCVSVHNVHTYIYAYMHTYLLVLRGS